MSEAYALISNAPDSRLAELVHIHYHEVLYLYAAKCCRNMRLRHCSAKDVLQDVYIKIHLKSGTFRKGYLSHQDAYLYKMVTNQVKDARRSEQLRDRMSQMIGEDLANGRTEQRLSMEEMRENIYKLLDLAVKPPFLECLRLFVDGYKYQEIADKLDLTINTVSSRLSRAREQLAAFCKEQNERFGADYPDLSKQRRRKRCNKPPNLFDEGQEQQ